MNASPAPSPTNIRVGDKFSWGLATFRRMSNDLKPQFPNFRFRIKCLSNPSVIPPYKPYTFNAEAEWFTQRGFKAI